MKRFGSPAMMLPALVALFLLLQAPALSYLFDQGAGFYHTVYLAHDIEKLRASGTIDEPTERLFDRVDDIRSFAFSELGLQRSENFTRYTPLDRNHLVSVVHAVRDDRMRRHTWYYPLFGHMFYRGYWNEEHAEAEARRLEGEGYDAIVRPVHAFSSLGYFRDPVYSFMRNYDDYRLANLIIHEEMHANVWINGQNVYNEEIATFVGDEGAALYIAHKFGTDSDEYRRIADGRADREQYREWIRGVYRELTDAYTNLRSREERLAAKEKIFADAQALLAENYDAMFTTDRYRSVAERPLNNAVIDLSYSYAGDLTLYYDLYEQVGGDLSAVIDIMRSSRRFPDSPHSYIAGYIDHYQVGATGEDHEGEGF